ncbi:MAG: serine hydrolase [Candidatus Sumerlaeota bacterium]
MLLVTIICGIAACSPRGIRISGARSDERGGFVPGTLALINDEIRMASRENDICGGALAIHHSGEEIQVVTFGRLSRDENAKRVDEKTLFDIASLTKPVAGVPAFVLDAPRPDRPDALLRPLSHTSTLDDARDYAAIEELCDAPDRAQQVADWVHRAVPSQGKLVYAYGNSNYALLSFAMSRASNELENAIRIKFWGDRLTYRPVSDSNIATSGLNANGQTIRGTPFDPLASRMITTTNRLPLHSGLFASAPAVAGFVDNLANPDSTSPERRACGELLFGAPRTGLTPKRDTIYFSDGGLVSPTHPPLAPEGARPGRVYYQTGYTGCLLWVDTQTHTTVVLLTNASLTNAQEEETKLSEDIITILLRGMKR